MRIGFLLLLLAAVSLDGCAAKPVVPKTATLIARGANPDDAVTIPAGTKVVYFVQRGPITMNVTRWPVEATTRSTTMPVLPLFWGSGSKPVDVYAAEE